MTENSKIPSNTSKNSDDKNLTPSPYSKSSTTPFNKMWLIPIVLVTLGVGMFGGKMWAEKELSDTEKSVTPQVATATGITEVEKPASQKPVLTVETITPEQSTVENNLSADGTISAETTATVNAKVNNVTIDKVMVKEGAWVKKGQVLAVFDTDAMRQQRTQAQAELAEAQTSYELARRDVERVQPLIEMQAVSQQEYDRYVATANQAEASVIASKARLDSQNLNMKNANVTAPVSGVISDKTANVGSVPGPEPLFTIIEDGKLEWQAQVDPSKLGGIRVGTPVKVSLPNNKNVMGKVSRVAPTTKEGSRQVTIYAALDKHPNARAGMYQRGTFMLGSDAKMTIPVSAVVTQDGYDYVMQVKEVKDENRKTIYRISRIKVKLGERNGDRAVLLEPLPGKGNIVRQGGSFLNDGDIVRIADSAKVDDPKADGTKEAKSSKSKPNQAG